MKLTEINGKHLYSFFYYGHKRIQEKQAHLNKINVFPVPDGDTGNNLVQTTQSMIDATPSVDSVSQVGNGLADAALTGSRGNSGIIFAQFVQGLSETFRDRHVLNPGEFIKATRNGVDQAYNALSKPVEGTILTVMRAWSNSLHAMHEKGLDLNENLHHSLDVAKKALKDTTQQLQHLREAGVVDAGAEGFVHFLEGISHFIRHGHTAQSDADAPASKESFHLETIDQEMDLRYCTEVFLKGEDLNAKEIREMLEPMGDSIITAGSSKKMHIHVHTNTPEIAVEKLRKFGTVFQQKIDDMKRQYEAFHKRKFKIAIVTDSACDLPRELLDQYQIHVIPLNIAFGPNVYLDKLSILPKRFYELLDEEPVYPHTSQPSVKQIEILYRSLAAAYDSIISIHLSGALSGTLNTAKQAAALLEDYPITVLDSKTLATSLGLIVLHAAMAVEQGDTYETVVNKVEKWSGESRIYVSVQTLNYMVKGGRVSPLKGKIAKWLNLKPIVSLDDTGKSALIGKAFSADSNIQKILELVKKQQKVLNIKGFAIGHANALDEARAFADKVAAVLGFEASYCVDIAPVIGVHAGKGALCVSLITE